MVYMKGWMVKRSVKNTRDILNELATEPKKFYKSFMYMKGLMVKRSIKNTREIE